MCGPPAPLDAQSFCVYHPGSRVSELPEMMISPNPPNGLQHLLPVSQATFASTQDLDAIGIRKSISSTSML